MVSISKINPIIYKFNNKNTAPISQNNHTNQMKTNKVAFKAPEEVEFGEFYTPDPDIDYNRFLYVAICLNTLAKEYKDYDTTFSLFREDKHAGDFNIKEEQEMRKLFKNSGCNIIARTTGPDTKIVENMYAAYQTIFRSCYGGSGDSGLRINCSNQIVNPVSADWIKRQKMLIEELY